MKWTLYLKNLTGIELNDLVTSETGEEKSEDFAYIKLQLKTDSYDDICERLASKCGKPVPLEGYPLPAAKTHALIAEFRENTEPRCMYKMFMSGKKARTRSLEFYISEDDDGGLFLYVFG